MNPLSSKAHSLAQTRQTKHRTNRTENQHEQSDKADFGAQVSRMRRRYSALSAESGRFGLSNFPRAHSHTYQRSVSSNRKLSVNFGLVREIRKPQSHGPQRAHKPLWQTPYWILARSFQLSLVLSLRLVYDGQEIWFANKGKEHCYILVVSI